MHNRAARLMLFCLFVAALSVAGFLFWRGEARVGEEETQARAFDASTRSAMRSLLNLRSGQQAYVAAGQGVKFWGDKVALELETARSTIKVLASTASSPQARTAIEATGSTVEDLGRINKRATDYVRNDQRLLASDVIFADGVELSDAALASLDQAATLETQARQYAIDTLKRRQLFALLSGAAASVLAVLLLLPGRRDPSTELRVETASPLPVERLAPSPPVATQDEGWSAPAHISRTVERLEEPGGAAPEEPPAEPVAPPAATEVPIVVPAAAAAVATTDFVGLASLCVDLARVADTRALPNLLDRAASILDAHGIILWIADPDGRELNPIFAQGYPLQLVNRLGTIPKEAQNATAAAFRTALLQTVKADEISPGAIAAPLVTAGGCVGVMAAEVKHEAEQQEGTLAAATIVAAQLATLVGPPSARSQAKTGSAGA
jgi:GAF domain